MRTQPIWLLLLVLLQPSNCSSVIHYQCGSNPSLVVFKKLIHTLYDLLLPQMPIILATRNASIQKSGQSGFARVLAQHLVQHGPCPWSSYWYVFQTFGILAAPLFLEYYLSCFDQMVPLTTLQCFCDNIGFIITLNLMQETSIECPNDTTADNCNLFLEIMTTAAQCMIITFQNFHVKGHQDTNLQQQLMVQEQPNVDCNHLAKQYVKSSPLQSTSFDPELEATHPHLIIEGHIICCWYLPELHQAAASSDYFKYLWIWFNWTLSDICRLQWQMLHCMLQLFPCNDQQQIVLFINDKLPLQFCESALTPVRTHSTYAKNYFPVLRLQVHPVGTHRKSHDDHDNFDGSSHLSPAHTNYNDSPQAFPYLTNINCIKIGRLLQLGSNFDKSIWATGMPYQVSTTNSFASHRRPPCQWWSMPPNPFSCHCRPCRWQWLIHLLDKVVQLQQQGFWLLIGARCNHQSVQMHATMDDSNNDGNTHYPTNHPHPSIPYTHAAAVHWWWWGSQPLIGDRCTRRRMQPHATMMAIGYDDSCTTFFSNQTNPQMTNAIRPSCHPCLPQRVYLHYGWPTWRLHPHHCHSPMTPEFQQHMSSAGKCPGQTHWDDQWSQ